MSYAVVSHPILSHNLTVLRDKNTPSHEFRRVLSEVSKFLAYEATRDLKTATVEIETPMEKIGAAPKVSEKIVVAPILRAGAAMVEGVLETLPFASVGHIGIYRDKFINNTVEYFFRLPKDPQGQRVLLLDMLLATGDTAVSAIQRLKEYGVGQIHFLCLLASPEGLARIEKLHPDVHVHCLSIERSLDSKGYILPGLGDAGDRLYGAH